MLPVTVYPVLPVLVVSAAMSALLTFARGCPHSLLFVIDSNIHDCLVPHQNLLQSITPTVIILSAQSAHSILSL